jgi:hypothetical protein
MIAADLIRRGYKIAIPLLRPGGGTRRRHEHDAPPSPARTQQPEAQIRSASDYLEI